MDAMNTFSAVRDEISAENMLDTVRKIASWERLSGSAEELEAFHYLKKRLEAYDYRTRLLSCDAYISLPVSCRLLIDGVEVRAQTHSMVPSARATATLVYCASATDINEADCTGKIVLMRGRAVFAPVQAAQNANAVGIVFVQEAVIRECIPSGCWGSPTPEDWELFPKIPVASVVDSDVQPIVDSLLEGKQIAAELTTVTDTSWRKIPLLIGDLKSPAETNRFVQFTGHLDSWYYGAVDNGTSNALQLEVARLARLHREELKRNFRVVYFSGHSHGRYAGSAWYADHFWEDLHENCVININTDSVGGVGADDISHSIVMPETKGLAVEIVHSQTGQTFEGVRCGRLGDQSFWNVGLANAFASFSRQKKIPVSDGRLGFARGNAELGPGWHTPEDTLDKIDPDNLLRDGKIVGEYVMTFLTASRLPLDYTLTAEDILHRLEDWAKVAGDAFDLSGPIQRAGELLDVCRQFDSAQLEDTVRNEVLLRLGRILVPLGFTRGNIYGTEPAMAIDPMPSLSPIRALTAQGTEQWEKMAIRLTLVRAVNYINHSLLQAIRLLRQSI